MIGREPLKITPLISISQWIYSSMHENEDGDKYSSMGKRILTKIVDFCTIIVGLIEAIVRGVLGLIGLIFLTIIDYQPDKGSIAQKVIGDILCSGGAASFEAIICSSVSLFFTED